MFNNKPRGLAQRKEISVCLVGLIFTWKLLFYTYTFSFGWDFNVTEILNCKSSPVNLPIQWEKGSNEISLTFITNSSAT